MKMLKLNKVWKNCLELAKKWYFIGFFLPFRNLSSTKAMADADATTMQTPDNEELKGTHW